MRRGTREETTSVILGATLLRGRRQIDLGLDVTAVGTDRQTKHANRIALERELPARGLVGEDIPRFRESRHGDTVVLIIDLDV